MQKSKLKKKKIQICMNQKHINLLPITKLSSVQLAGNKCHDILTMIEGKNMHNGILYDQVHWKYFGTAKFSHFFLKVILSHICLSIVACYTLFLFLEYDSASFLGWILSFYGATSITCAKISSHNDSRYTRTQPSAFNSNPFLSSNSCEFTRLMCFFLYI